MLVFVSAPVLGALSDQSGRRLPFFLVCTIACVVCTAALGLGGLWVTLGVFVVANYFFQASLIFYDATLSVVSTPATRGVVGGFGRTALMFAIFAVPIFLVIKEPQLRAKVGIDFGAVRSAFGRVRNTFRTLPRYRGLGRFLVGRVFYTDAANTVIIFLGIYTTQEIGFDDTGAQLLMLVAIVFAVLGGLITGAVVDPSGPNAPSTSCWACGP